MNQYSFIARFAIWFATIFVIFIALFGFVFIGEEIKRKYGEIAEFLWYAVAVVAVIAFVITYVTTNTGYKG